MNKHVEAEWRFPAKTAWAIFAAMIFGNFMAILDIQIVASSLNEVQAGMSASRYEVTWVQTVYLIAEIIAIPMSNHEDHTFDLDAILLIISLPIQLYFESFFALITLSI